MAGYPNSHFRVYGGLETSPPVTDVHPYTPADQPHVTNGSSWRPSSPNKAAARAAIDSGTGSAPGDFTKKQIATMAGVVANADPSWSPTYTFQMPNCFGMTASGCLSSMQTLGFTGTMNETTVAVDQADFTQPAGAILSTAPAAGAAVSIAASAVVEANKNGEACSWRVDYPHWSEEGGTVLAKGYATCTYQTAITATLYLWKCTEPPSSDPQDLSLEVLNNGGWGCVPAGYNVQTRVAPPNQEQAFYVPDTGEARVGGDDHYFVAYGTLDKGTPSADWSVNPNSIPQVLPG